MNGFDYYSWIILPLLICLSRMCDVTLGTLRHIFMHKGLKKLVPLLGFFEVLIWLVVISRVMKNLDNWMCYIGWAGGFSCGTMLGMYLEEKLALGLQVIRIITNQDCTALILAMKESRRGLTVVDAQGAIGPVKMIFTIVPRKQIRDVEKLISQYNPSAFYSVEEVKNVNQGVFASPGSNFSLLRQLIPWRKGK
ncbi:MAG TPA: DUF2179 domain-containing protein [Bacteroidia bacterium]|nr:DUF2179 domain-containing protein [Bacteroidia bacterium]